MGIVIRDSKIRKRHSDGTFSDVFEVDASGNVMLAQGKKFLSKIDANTTRDIIATDGTIQVSQGTSNYLDLTNRPTALSQFTNDLGNYGGFLTASSLSGYATQAWVTSTLIDSAPSTLDTLNELAAALGDDPNFATTVTNNIAGKVAKSGDTMTGQLTITGGRLLLQTGGTDTYGLVSGYNNNNHLMTMRAAVSGATSSPTYTAGHQMTFVEYAEANDTTGWFFKSSSTGTYEEIARITRSGITWNGNTVIHSGNIGSQSVNYAASAGAVAWGNVSGRPTALSSFTNDLGNYGGWIVQGTQITSGASWTTATRFGSVGDISQDAGNHALSVRSEDGNDAFMSFHIGNDYAVHFGLERSTA